MIAVGAAGQTGSDHSPAFQTDAEMFKALGNVGTTIFHPVSTCKMGRADDGSAVVDPTLKVRGIEGRRVIDASVMSSVTKGNTNSPTVMITKRGRRRWFWITRGKGSAGELCLILPGILWLVARVDCGLLCLARQRHLLQR